MPDVESSHLRSAAPAGGRDGETHLVEDIHERERSGRVGASARHIRTARPQRREGVTNSCAALKRQPRLVDLLQDVVHRVVDRARDRAVDRRGGGFVLERARVGDHAAGRNGAATQRPEEALVPVLAHLVLLDVGERARDALVGIVHRFIDGRAVLGGQAIFLIPDIERRLLEGDGVDVFRIDLDDGVHVIRGAPNALTPRPTDFRKCRSRRFKKRVSRKRRSSSREPDRHPLSLQNSQVPETSPRPVTPGRPRANTRSCVGVKSLMSVRGGVKRGDRLLEGQ